MSFLYIKCPSCGTMIGHLQQDYDNKMKELNYNLDLTNVEKQKKKTTYN